MKGENFHQKEVNDLQKLLKTKQARIRKIRLGVIETKNKDFKEINKIKRDLARIITILKEKEVNYIKSKSKKQKSE